MIIGSQIYHKKKCYNSLLWAQEKIEQASDGAIFLADIHEYCRGRQDRIWKFSQGQLAVTLLLKPKNLKIQQKNISLRLNQLNMAVTLGILRALEKFGIVLKWPNDFMHENKKVGGMICQVIWQSKKLQGIIFGFAININNEVPILEDQSYYSAISLKQIYGKEIDEKILFNNLLTNIDEFYCKWLSGKFDEIFEIWKSSQTSLGKKLKIHKIDGSLVSGIFHDVLPNGDLVLRIKKEQEIVPFFDVLQSVLIE